MQDGPNRDTTGGVGAALEPVVRRPLVPLHEIPALAPLMGVRRWLVWSRSADGRKVPKSPSKDARWINAENLDLLSDHWTAYCVAVRNGLGNPAEDGVGYSFAGEAWLVCIDVDSKGRNPDGTWPPHIEALLNMCHTFTEVSFSGGGLHIIGFCTDPVLRDRFHRVMGVHGCVDVFTTAGYVAITGREHPLRKGAPLADVTPILRELEKHAPQPKLAKEFVELELWIDDNDQRSAQDMVDQMLGHKDSAKIRLVLGAWQDVPVWQLPEHWEAQRLLLESVKPELVRIWPNGIMPSAEYLASNPSYDDGFLAFKWSAADFFLMLVIARVTTDYRAALHIFRRSALMRTNKREGHRAYGEYLIKTFQKAIAPVIESKKARQLLEPMLSQKI